MFYLTNIRPITKVNYCNDPSNAVSYETICIQRHLLQFKKRTWHRSPFRLLLPHCASLQSKWNRFCSKTLILRKDWIHWSYPIKKMKKNKSWDICNLQVNENNETATKKFFIPMNKVWIFYSLCTSLLVNLHIANYLLSTLSNNASHFKLET